MNAASRRQSSHDVELDPVDEGVVADRPGMGRPVPKSLTVSLARCRYLVVGYGREGQYLEGVDLDDDAGSAVAAAHP
jgi:hypothetical protein